MIMKNQFVLISFLLILHIIVSYADLEPKVYIVYLGEHSGKKTSQEIEDHHHTYLHSVKGSKEAAKASLVYSYKNIINGFSALLTPDEAAKLSKMEGVVSVFHSPPGTNKLQTTRSWDFMNLLEADGNPTSSGREELLRKASLGKNVVVGVLDSGIWPESESFNDEGMEPVPSWWKGICEAGEEFNKTHCNRKIIGARYYLKGYERQYGRLDSRIDYRSARDIDGHGTHTASTVGGRRVTNVSALGGFANGTATGGAPLVRLAIYKVCWRVPNKTLEKESACFTEDMMAAFDDAINDGVQVISVSIGSNTSRPYFEDGTAIGSLHALNKNIIVVCSAGNNGPTPGSVTNVAPWIITVGASSIDRVFPAPVTLGNSSMEIEGQTITPLPGRRNYPLVYAGDVEIPGKTNHSNSGLCRAGTLSPERVQGRTVLCLRGDIFEAREVRRAGGAAAILGNPRQGNQIQLSAHVLPETTVFLDNAITIRNYARNTRNPMVTLVPGKTVIGTNTAPVMAPFTSVGPNLFEPNILKPDIAAPGFNILAAWSEASSPTKLPGDRRVVKYNIISGTSMSCPHVSAIAVLLKAIHPNWSSAAIRSALMTTAKLHNNMGKPITDAVGNVATPFQLGAGHLQPSKASDPGLVYDATYTDYLLFLCNRGYHNAYPPFKCPPNPPSQSNLNYPSLAISNLRGSMTVNRTVTNVGKSNSTYKVTIIPPLGYTVQIYPTTLYFSQNGEKRSFNITIAPQRNAQVNKFAFGWYTWSDGLHEVRSPIAVSSA